MMDKKLKTCPECDQDTLHRLIGSGSGIIFKGSGFYETDYKNKSAAPSPSGGCCGGNSGCGAHAGSSGTSAGSDKKVNK